MGYHVEQPFRIPNQARDFEGFRLGKVQPFP